MNDLSSISNAIVVWTGWGYSSWPQRDEQRLIQEFGAERAGVLIHKLQELEEDFYSSNARFVAKDLAEMGQIASEQFRSKHPELAEEAIQALAWCYTYDFK